MTTPPFTFHVAVSWAKKDRLDCGRTPFTPDSRIGKWRDEMLSLRRDGDGRDPGDDFFYITKTTKGVSFGVADGVSAWEKDGVDPSLFPQSLMYYAYRGARGLFSWADSASTELRRGISPMLCIRDAYDSVMKDEEVEVGSSTACLIELDATSGILVAANLGDSGFMIIRSSSVIYQQPEQTHSLNCPYQMAKVPPEYGQSTVDPPHKAADYQTNLQDGDIVVAYTDGLSDNVFHSKIAYICSRITQFGYPEDDQVQFIANALVQEALRGQRSNDTPAALKLSPRYREDFRGLPDDTTVIVALVRKTVSEPLVSEMNEE